MSKRQPSDLWGVRVFIERYNPAWADMQGSLSRAEWNARLHRSIVLKSAHDPTLDPRPPQEMLPAYQWCCGFLARVLIDFYETEFRPSERHLHHPDCHSDNSFWCGDTISLLDDPAASVIEESPPSIEVLVPTEEAKEWLVVVERIVNTMLARDRAPLPATQQPDQHVGPHLTEQPTTAAQQEPKR